MENHQVELEQRVQALEREVSVLKGEIQRTLGEIQSSLPETPAVPAHWQKRAWLLALFNILLAVALFTNIYFYLPGYAPFNLDPNLIGWLRAGWIAVAFIWLLLQMYPLVLLLQDEDAQLQHVAWRNAVAFLRVRPAFMVLLTLAVLIVSIINLAMPAAWIIVALGLLVAVGSIAMRNLFELLQQKKQA